MGVWRDQVQAKADLIHGQLVSARQLAQQFGGDQDEVSKPYLALLSSLYSEEFPIAALLDDSDLVIRFEGPAVTAEGPPAGVVSGALAQIRRQVRGVAKAVIGLTAAEVKWPGGFDPHLSGIAHGSLVIGVRVPRKEDLHLDPQLHIEGVDDQVLDSVRAAVRGIKTVARHIDDDKIDKGIADELPDPGIRDALLVAAESLAPTGKKGINRVSFLGGDETQWTGREGPLGEAPALTPRSKVALRAAIQRPVMFEPRHGSFTGTVREMDLDARRFEIRGVAGVSGGIRCVYPPKYDQIAKAFLDSVVEVTGEYESLLNEMPRLIRVDRVNVVKPPWEQPPLLPSH